jgi:F-type H+-transporting ATPase subunit b
VEQLMAESKNVHPSAHTEVPSEGHGQFPPFRTDTFASQLFWLVVTFVALYLMVSKIALPRVGGILDARQGRIAGDLATANRLKEEADAAMMAYEQALAEARARAQSITQATHEKLVAEAERNRKTVEEQLNTKLLGAEKTIAATKDQAMANVRAIALEAASTIVSQLTGVSPAEATVAHAIDEVLKR